MMDEPFLAYFVSFSIPRIEKTHPSCYFFVFLHLSTKHADESGKNALEVLDNKNNCQLIR